MLGIGLGLTTARRPPDAGLELIAPGRMAGTDFSRASGATYYDAAGLFTQAAADVPRYSGPARRLMIEGARTESIRNPRGEGTGGTISGTNVGVTNVPTNWTAVAWNSAGTLTFAQATDGGRPCVDIIFTGFVTTNPDLRIFLDSMTQVPAAAGQPWVSTISAKVVSGAMPAVTTGANRLAIRESASGGGNTGVSGSDMLFDTSGFKRVSHARTLAGATTAFVSTSIFNGDLVVGQTVNLRLRVCIEMLEMGAFASSAMFPPVGSPAPAPRAVDFPRGALSSPAAGTLLVKAMLPQAAVSVPQGIIRVDSSADGNRIDLRNSAGGSNLDAVIVSGGATLATLNLGAMVPGAVFRAAIAWQAGNHAALLAGGAVQTAAVALPPGLNRILYGHAASDLSQAMFGELETVRFLPYRAGNAELASRLAAL